MRTASEVASMQRPCTRNSQPLRVLARIPSFFRRFVTSSHWNNNGDHPATSPAGVPSSRGKAGSAIQLVEVKRSVECRASAESCAAAPDEITVNFHVPQYVTSLGEELRVVGAGPALGSWDVYSAPSMSWQDGHSWILQMRLPVGQYEFKLAVVSGRGVIWENGVDRKITIKLGEKILGPEAKVSVSCDFNATDATKMETKYDKAFLRDRLNKAQKVVVSLTQRKLSLQKQLVSLLHQAQDSDRVTKEMVVGVLAGDGRSVAHLQLPHSSRIAGLTAPVMDDKHFANEDVATPPTIRKDDASQAVLQPLDARVMQQALSSSLQQLVSDPAISDGGSIQHVSDVVAPNDVNPQPSKIMLTHASSTSDHDHSLHQDVAFDETNIFRSINVHRGLVDSVNSDWYATSVTASMQDEIPYGFWSAHPPAFPPMTESPIEQESFPCVSSHAVSLDEDAEYCSTSTSNPDNSACIRNLATTALNTLDKPELVSHPVEECMPEDQKIWTDVMGMMVHSHFWHMLRLSAALGRPQLLLLQLSVAITAASVGRGWPLSSTTSSVAPTTKSAPCGWFAHLGKALAPVSAITRRLFPATTAALVGVVVVGWYARVASAGVN